MSPAAALPAVLALPDVASKEWIIRQYDHEVQGGSVIKPLLGPGDGPADGTAIRGVLGRDRGLVLGVGLRHRLGTLDPWQMAAGAIVEAIANVVATGADPDRIALLDNFCWGDVRRETSLGPLVEACRACHEVAIAFAAPFVSGKDSLNNVFAWTDPAGVAHERSIPPTLLVTALGQLDDVRRALSPALTVAEAQLAIVGLTRDDLAGSQAEVLGLMSGGRVPAVDLAACRAAVRAVATAAAGNLLCSCHDISDGGLLVAAAEMAIGGQLGLELRLGDVPITIDDTPPAARDLATAFSETPGRFLCAVRPGDAAAFAAALRDVPWAWIGTVGVEPVLKVIGSTGGVDRIPVDQLATAWRSTAAAQAETRQEGSR